MKLSQTTAKSRTNSMESAKPIAKKFLGLSAHKNLSMKKVLKPSIRAKEIIMQIAPQLNQRAVFAGETMKKGKQNSEMSKKIQPSPNKTTKYL